jgi:hypothetical protein
MPFLSMTSPALLLAAVVTTAVLPNAACVTTTGSGADGAADDPRREVRAAVARSRSVDARVDLRVEVAVDGVTEARIVTTGVVVRGGAEFDLEILGPASFGAETGPDASVQVRLVDGRLFQRGAVVAELIPEGGERWVDMGHGASDTAAMGLVGPGGFAALDLLDDLGDVSSPAPHRYEGSLRDVAVDGGRIVGVERAHFALDVVEGSVSSLAVALHSHDGVELTVRLLMNDLDAPASIVTPAAADVLVLDGPG